ncbi:cupin [Variovorax sp. WS11]|uniref:JmjC domain-containing protein n=1 Tax=Variovorax sp. WS11 TaxID=1105204 RepID=UPI000D0DADB1|nr:cupin domain-containing protein [Variovorax sp. WS11]NDZ15872.1 cupin [Variovorax sp. WS11]PSL80628.1 cupin [Variovorax sp. WS11]
MCSISQPAMPGSTGTYHLWADDPAAFSTHRITPLHHNFHEHPLFQVAELIKLGKELAPLEQCRFMRPGLTPASVIAHDSRHPDGRSIDEFFERLEEPASSVALYNIEVIPRYQALLWAVVGIMQDSVEAEQPDVFRVNGFVFISAPPSVTPFHIDRENNFWLQLHGRKIMNVWDHRDRRIVPAEAVEDFIVTHSLRKVRYREEFRTHSQEFHARPGDGVYFPSTSPHMTRSDPDWTGPGDRVSISIGVTFYTSITRKVARVHQVNRVMRRCGLSPRYPGESPRTDAFKASLGGLVGSARAKLIALDPSARRFKLATTPPPGSY